MQQHHEQMCIADAPVRTLIVRRGYRGRALRTAAGADSIQGGTTFPRADVYVFRFVVVRRVFGPLKPVHHRTSMTLRCSTVSIRLPVIEIRRCRPRPMDVSARRAVRLSLNRSLTLSLRACGCFHSCLVLHWLRGVKSTLSPWPGITGSRQGAPIMPPRSHKVFS